MAPEPLSAFLGSEDPENVTVIRNITNDILVFSMPHMSGGSVRLGARCTVFRMVSGDLTVLSPLPLSAPVKKAVESFGGSVKYIGLMNHHHHLYASEWHTAYPSALFIVMEGLIDRRRSLGYPDLPLRYEINANVGDKPNPNSPDDPAQLPPDFTSEFSITFMSGQALKEIVYLHKPSKTLVQADLLYNLPPTEQYSKSSINPTAGNFTNRFTQYACKKPALHAWLLRNFLRKDPVSWNEAYRHIYNDWDWDRMIPCHGDIIESGAKKVFYDICRPFL